MIDEDIERRLALSFPVAIELPHWDHPSSRAGKRISATAGESAGHVDEQEALLQAMPGVFVVSAWSKGSWLGVRFDAAGTSSPGLDG